MFKQENISSYFDSESDDESAFHRPDDDCELSLPEPFDEEDQPPEAAGHNAYATHWQTVLPVPCQDEHFPSDQQQNHFTGPSGPNESTLAAIKSAGGVLAAFQLLFDEYMAETIVKYTRAKANSTERFQCWSFTVRDLYHYLAILLGKASCDARHLTASDMFSFKWGSPFYAKCLNKSTFETINRFLCFDDVTSREGRLASDSEAVISEIWNIFNTNCQEVFQPGATLAMGTQMAHCQARCPFIHSERDSEGLKQSGLMYSLVVDADSGFVLNSRPHFHQVHPARFHGALQVGHDLLAPFLNKHRTIVGGQAFTSIDLASHLLSESTYFVGEYRHHHPDLPQHIEKSTLQRHHAEAFSCSDTFTLTRYKHKWNRAVSVLSSRHGNTVQRSVHGKKLPETYAFYDKHCTATKHIENTLKSCSTRLIVHRWKMYPFFNLLDLAAMNAQILHYAATGTRIIRRTFLRQLAEELAKLCDATPETVEPPSPEPPAAVEPDFAAALESSVILKTNRQRCKVRISPQCKQYKTTNLCRFCQRATCVSCRSSYKGICEECWSQRCNRTNLV